MVCGFGLGFGGLLGTVAVVHAERSHLVECLVFRLGRWTLGYLEKRIQTPMAQGRSVKIIWMKWIWTSRLSIKNSLSGVQGLGVRIQGVGFRIQGFRLRVHVRGFRKG